MARQAQQPEAQSLTRDQALALMEERAQSAHGELAGRTDAGADVLHYLALNGAAATRRAVAANPAAAADTNRHLADDGDDDVRAELARKIARLMPDLAAEESEHVRALTIETLERLARDQVVRVRAILAEEIKNQSGIPAFIVLMLARDVETMVAAPILEYSPLLSDADLKEIIATARAEELLAAIARRRPLGAVVSDAIVSSLDISAIAALLANSDASIRQQTLDRLAKQAETIQAWHTPIALRADLSRRAIARIASFVGSNLIEQLVARYGLDPEIKRGLNKALRARLKVEREAVVDAAAGEVAAARAAGTLDEDFVDTAAVAGRREVVLLALAAMAEVPETAVRKIFASRSAKPITALVWRAGLSMRVAFKIQTAVMRLKAGELLPARAGLDFPISEDEMRWHLNYFQVT
jgi:uncharacterized protein (DUF2336 family)